MTTLEEVFLKLEEEEDDNNNEASELEENTGLRSNALLTAGETDIGASSNNLYGSSGRKRHVSLWVHLMALLEVPG